MKHSAVSQAKYDIERREAETTVLAAAAHLEQEPLELLNDIMEQWRGLDSARNANGKALAWDQDDLFERMYHERMSLETRRHMKRAVYALYDQGGNMSFMSVHRARKSAEMLEDEIPLAPPPPRRARV